MPQKCGFWGIQISYKFFSPVRNSCFYNIRSNFKLVKYEIKQNFPTVMGIGIKATPS